MGVLVLSLAATVWLMLNLKTSTWTMFGVWMVVGLAIYGATSAENIWIIDGGLAVTLGRGGADLPPSSEKSNG